MATTVFLSHAAADGDLIRKVAAHAATLDILTYAYEDDTQGGGTLAAKLQERIASSDAVIVLLTQNSQHRPSVHTEVGIARALGKPIIPVIELGVDAHQFVFLQGIESIALNVNQLDEALLGVQRSLKRLVEKAKDNALTTAAIAALIIALIILAAKQKG
jgi:nucleoside 2-deoxyribosyltransferase